MKDFEGDGALLYFESAAEAAQAAMAIQSALLRAGEADASSEPISARVSLTIGDVLLGVAGTALRKAVALMGPSVNVGSRLLKQIEPGGVIASGELVEALRAEQPELASKFKL